MNHGNNPIVLVSNSQLLICFELLMFRNLTRIVALSILLLGSINFSWQLYRMHQESIKQQIRVEQGLPTGEYFGPSLDRMMRLFTEPLLVLILVGSLFRGVAGKLLSSAGLAGATFFYVVWWREYFHVRQAVETATDLRLLNEDCPHYLCGGNYLDLCVAALLLLLILLYFVWAVKWLFRSKANAQMLDDGVS